MADAELRELLSSEDKSNLVAVSPNIPPTMARSRWGLQQFDGQGFLHSGASGPGPGLCSIMGAGNNTFASHDDRQGIGSLTVMMASTEVSHYVWYWVATCHCSALLCSVQRMQYVCALLPCLLSL